MDRKKRGSLKIMLIGIVLCFGTTGSWAGLPEPPIIILGELQTTSGLPVSSGSLRFDFTPVGGGDTVQVEAFVGAFASDITFFAIIPLERGPVSDANATLEFGNSKAYNLTAFYNGTPVNAQANSEVKLLNEPYEPMRLDLIGPLSILVSPTGPQVSVSPSINFGFVQLGGQAEKSFEIYNVGTEAFTGTARLQNSGDYDLIEGGVPVIEVAVNLGAGETLVVPVRFQPSTSSPSIEDVFQVRTGGGDADRNLLGRSVLTGSPDPDLDSNGVIDHNDLYLLLLSWYYSSPSIPKPQTDLNRDNVINHPDLLKLLNSIKN
ncbi:MAG: hypothetical protein KC978_07720 [Candidatus Omnitrophica bacterium]|nr:hypothetical protein [Candidatus Omnitrophota bacterium]